MAQPKTLAIELGGHVFTVQRLTLSQVETIDEALNDQSLAGHAIRQGKAIVGAALSRDHGDVDLDETEGTALELAHATAAVLRFGGFMPEAPSSGEERAAAPRASTGRKSKAG